LKPLQVGHILRDSGASVLVTTSDRLRELDGELASCSSLRTVVTVDGAAGTVAAHGRELISWDHLLAPGPRRNHRVIDSDMAAILYTSGSTGRPKGVVLSHRNMVTGAKSVAGYLQNTTDDVLLAVLPFSFDYGFSQLSTAFDVGACVVLLDYLFPRDVLNAVKQERITGLAAVPPLWIQLAQLNWDHGIGEHLRYFTNSGGRMPRATLDKLRAALPRTRPFLMYGLTEAFRATYLPPEEVERRSDSIGKAIPNAEVLVVRPDGSRCAPGEHGELVQRGALVSLGYWNDPAKTAERFRPVPQQRPELPITEYAVWSGDTARTDEDGFLYFVGRRDEMIKTSGYRVSPTEVEEVVYASALVGDAVAVAAPHAELGEGIVLVASPNGTGSRDTAALLDYCRAQLPLYMIPGRVEWLDELPRNPNGKFDRPLLAARYRDSFGGAR
jgi:acyl-CoA ligase (AMP-forming) (exosortase A-associated)